MDGADNTVAVGAGSVTTASVRSEPLSGVDAAGSDADTAAAAQNGNHMHTNAVASEGIAGTKRSVDSEAPNAAAAADDGADEPAAKRVRANNADAGSKHAADTAVGNVQPAEQQSGDQEPAGAAAAATAHASAVQSPKATAGPSVTQQASPATTAATNNARSASPAKQGKRLGDVIYRVLIHHRSVAIIIGKGGSTVKELEHNSGARVQVMTAVPACEERVVVVSVPEDQQVVSGAEKALLAIHRKLILDMEPTAAAELDTMQHPAVAAADAAAPLMEVTGIVAAPHGAAAETVSQPTAEVAGVETAPEHAAAATDAAGIANADANAHTMATTETGLADAADTVTTGAASGQQPAPDAAATNTAAADVAVAAVDASAEHAAATAAPDQQQQQQAVGMSPSADAANSTAAAAASTASPAAPSAASAAAAPAASTSSAASPAKPTVHTASARSVQHVVRLLVSPSQATSLLVSGAAGLRAIKDGAGAYVKVLQPDESPWCALDGDRVTQVVGKADQVYRAVQLLGIHLRKHPPTERPAGMHPGLAARVAGARRYGGPMRSPPPPPPPRAGGYGPSGYSGPPAAYGGYGAPPPPHRLPPPAYGMPPHGYGGYSGYGY